MATVRLDRVEGDTAVLVWQGRAFDVPAALLPADVREGDALELAWQVDRDATERLRGAVEEKRARLSKDDDGGDFSL